MSEVSRQQQTDTILHENEKQLLKSVLIRDFHFGDKLGSGAFGDVMKVSAQWRPTQYDEWPTKNGEPVYSEFAMKVIRHEFSEEELDLDKEKLVESLENGLNELRKLRYLRHENIVKIFDVIGITYQKNGSPYAVICIFMECCDGTLDQLISEAKLLHTTEPHERDLSGMAPEHLTKHWFKDVMLGLEYLHRMGVAHKDLYPKNILYMYRERGVKLKDATIEQKFLHSIFKICDLNGISRSQEFFKNTLVYKKAPEHEDSYAKDLACILPLVKNEIIQPKRRLYSLSTESNFLDYCETGKWKDSYDDGWKQLSPEFRRFFLKTDNLKDITVFDILTDPWVDTDGQIRKKLEEERNKSELPSPEVKKVRRLKCPHCGFIVKRSAQTPDSV